MKKPRKTIYGFPERLKKARTNKNITQEKLSELLGYNSNYINKLEAGIRPPSVDTLMGLSDYLNISIDYLLYGDTNFEKDNLNILISKLSNDELESLITIAECFIRHNHSDED